MTWFTASSVSVNNGQLVVNVNAGDDIQLAQAAGGLIIGNNPPVEIKRTYRDGNNLPKIELRSAWPYANQAAQPAVAFPTDGDLAAATAVLKQLIDGFAIATQAQAQQGTDNINAMTALRVKQAIDFFRPVTTSSADTTPGRLLRVRDFGLGGDTINISPSELNNLNSNGYFSVVNSPQAPKSAGAYEIQHIQFDINSAKQIAYEAGTIDLDIQTRVKGGATWYPWRINYHSANIVGTVSQSGGTPTGAIIQRGSNANGQFVRFTDGTQICWVNRATGNPVNNPFGQIFTTGSNTWTYPIGFIGSPTLSMSENSGVGLCWGGLGEGAANSDSTTFAIFRATASAVVPNAAIIAIGRWF